MAATVNGSDTAEASAEVFGTGGIRIAGVLDEGEAPPPGTPAGTVYLIRPN